MNKLVKRILYIILLVVVVFIIAYPKIEFGTSKEETLGGSPDSSPLTVNAQEIRFEPMNFTVNVTGTILADESVALNSEISAKVDQVFFKEGQKIKENQLLVSLNDDEIEAELEKLRFTKKLNEENEYRQRRLLEKEAISKEEYDIALTTLNTSLADIKLLEVRKSKHEIRAPFSGTIGLRQVSVGSYINPGQLITNIYKIDRVKIDFAIPGRYLTEVDVGDKIEFTVDAYEDVFEGEIYAIEPQIDPQTRSIKLRAISENTDNKLLPGQFAKISLILEKIENAIMIPNEAVIPELNGKKVFVFKDGVVESKSIVTGVRNEDKIQVLSGLEPGEVVITSGLLQIRQGMQVNVQL